MTEIHLVWSGMLFLGFVAAALSFCLARVTSASERNTVRLLAQMEERSELERKDRGMLTRQLFASLKPEQYSIQRQLELGHPENPVPDHSDGAPTNGQSAPYLAHQLNSMPSLTQRAPAEIERRESLQGMADDLFEDGEARDAAL